MAALQANQKEALREFMAQREEELREFMAAQDAASATAVRTAPSCALHLKVCARPPKGISDVFPQGNLFTQIPPYVYNVGGPLTCTIRSTYILY